MISKRIHMKELDLLMKIQLKRTTIYVGRVQLKLQSHNNLINFILLIHSQ